MGERPAAQVPHRVVIIGGGFAGLYAAKGLRKAGDAVDVTLVDRDGRTAKVSHTILPTCQLSDAASQQDCICTCGANYTLGKCALPDML